MSRIGLITQAMLQLTVALFIVSDITKEKWIEKYVIDSSSLENLSSIKNMTYT